MLRIWGLFVRHLDSFFFGRFAVGSVCFSLRLWFLVVCRCPVGFFSFAVAQLVLFFLCRCVDVFFFLCPCAVAFFLFVLSSNAH